MQKSFIIFPSVGSEKVMGSLLSAGTFVLVGTGVGVGVGVASGVVVAGGVSFFVLWGVGLDVSAFEVVCGMGVLFGSTGLFADVKVIMLTQRIARMTRASARYTTPFMIFLFVW